MSAVRKPQSGRDPFLVACHVAKKKLGMDDEAYRAMLERVAGVRSSTQVIVSKKKAVLAEFQRLGASTASATAPTIKDRMQGPYAGKLQALWIAGYNLGIIHDKTDKACMSFVERMTKISHSRFLHQNKDGSVAIESLKKWLAREGGVSWQRNQFSQLPYINDPQFRIVQAQHRLLLRCGAIEGESGVSQIEFLKLRCAEFGIENAQFSSFKSRDWIVLMNGLGAELRAATGAR